MGNMRFKAGDRVKIKSLDWYNENKNEFGDVKCSLNCSLTKSMSIHCGSIQTIESVVDGGVYWMKENPFNWTDEMIEGLVEELIERVDDNGLPFNEWLSYKGAFHIPDGYELKDENGNIINATKIVLKKKKKEYPKTYKECCKIMGVNHTNELDFREHCDYETEITHYENSLLEKIEVLYRLIIRRDAYWKIAGEEMGLGKSWEPNWNHLSDKWVLFYTSNRVWFQVAQTRHSVFAFPTEEMRDAFYENFKEEIEICKELL